MAAHYITRRPRLGPVDAQIVYPLLLLMIHPRIWTLYVFAFMVLFLWYLSKKGVSAMMMTRIVRRFIVGNRRQIRSPWRRHYGM
ncbi:IcmT/TraK family protein [Pseudomonas putida]|uniref:IcmT/TraK family protein n=1 Tax=Pseudomonas putida TaxID=303 RepID=A0A8I1ED06_PSEPU|nr:IcmT/TraK family protein [Pseudomonas putida]MBI6883008.1 IcmT/TraK family protein [Pseudomonas putida]